MLNKNAKYKSSIAEHYSCFLSPILYQTARSCFLPLGLESGHLPDSALSASTSVNADHIPQFGRLNKIPASGKAGAWCAKSNDGNQWLQISFGRQTTVTKVATQGRYETNQWVTSYSLSYSVDGTHWVWYRLSDGHIKVWLTCSVFSGNYCSMRNQKMSFILISKLNNYSLKSRWIVAMYLPSREAARLIFLKPLIFTEIENNNCFII